MIHIYKKCNIDPTYNLISDLAVPVSFEELLAFITGADAVPPCGFSKAIDISFFTNDPGISRLPYVSTCALELFLPRGVSEVHAFKDLMLTALKESSGFGKM